MITPTIARAGETPAASAAKSTGSSNSTAGTSFREVLGGNLLESNKATARKILTSNMTPKEKYQAMRQQFPAEYWGPGRYKLSFADDAMGWPVGTAGRLSQAIDPYVGQGEYLLANGCKSADFEEGAVRIGYDASGSCRSSDTADNMRPGQLRDISQEWAQLIISGKAPAVSTIGTFQGSGTAYAAETDWQRDVATATRSAEGVKSSTAGAVDVAGLLGRMRSQAAAANKA